VADDVFDRYLSEINEARGDVLDEGWLKSLNELGLRRS